MTGEQCIFKEVIILTFTQAYKQLDQAEYLDLTNGETNDYKAVTLAKSALERLIPGERRWTPIATDKHGETDTYKCPICNSYVSLRYKSAKCEYDYCPHCGYMIND